MTSEIRKFLGEYEFLSNFYKSKVNYEGVDYPTVEHAFQAAKTPDETEKHRLLTAKSPVSAKRLGRKVTLRSDWESVKVDIMTTIIRTKFADPDLEQKLLDTKNSPLIEGNNWHDQYWGDCSCNSERCKGVGKNILGEILMKVRNEISDEK